MNLTYKTDYWDSPNLKSQFITFLKQIHNLDLTPWDQLGYWDNNYRPFSYFEDNKLVSNVCLYTMNMTVDGKPCKVAQISGVGTLPEYRRQGLAYELTNKAVEWAKQNHDFFFLFADDKALELYKKYGFQLTEEHKTHITTSTITTSQPTPKPGAIKLDINNNTHREQIYKFASERTPVSNILGVNNKGLLMFWLIIALGDYTHHIAELEILVIYKTEKNNSKNNKTTIYDIIGKSIPTFDKIQPYINAETDSTIEFLFMTDKLNLEDIKQIKTKENGLHLLGNFPLANSKFILPFTAHA